MSKGELREEKNDLTFRYVLGALVGLFVFMAIIARQGVGQWELDSLRFVYEASDSWRTFALVVTQTGSAWFWLALIALLFIARRRPGAALNMLRNGVLAYVAVAVIKFVVARPRPEILFHDVIPREVITFGLGFPSAHTTIATVMALTVSSFFKGTLRWIIPPVWIGSVAWSRLYLGVHTPLDVAGGILLGVIIILFARLLPKDGIWKQERPPKS